MLSSKRLREFIRVNYMIASEVARRLDVRDSTVYSWLQGEFRPANPKRITIFFALYRLNQVQVSPDRLRISRVQELARHS